MATLERFAVRSEWHLRALLLLALGATGSACRRGPREERSFAQVAPVLHRRCGPCHHPDGAAPFSLLEYAEVAPRARQLGRVVRSGYMPPWKPVAGHGEFRGARALTAQERALLLAWVDAGAPRGDLRAAPAPPRWPSEWQLGTPDLVLELPEAWDLAAEGRDVYRSFVLPTGLAAGRFVAAWEFLPRGRAVHHAILNVDRTGWARRQDALDAAQGFGGMGAGNVSAPDGFYLVWTPGQQPTPPAEGSAWRLTPRTDLVLQLHMHPTGRPERVRPLVGLYFTDRPPQQTRITLRLGDGPIDIPAGERDWVLRDHFVLPADVELFGLFPHAHYVARRILVWATLPDGRREPLLRIDDWDPAWQDEYTYATPRTLPRGTRVDFEAHYDNSADNVRNPSSPPQRVRGGEQTSDEMGNVTLAARPRDPRELPVLQEFKYRRALDGSATAEYNYGNALSRLGRAREAEEHLARAVAADGNLGPARFNLATLRLQLGDAAGALEQLDAIRPSQGVEPGEVATNRAQALLALGRFEEAVSAARDATRADPRSVAALGTLAQALARHGDDARDAWRGVLAVAPEHPGALVGLGDAQRARGELEAARQSYESALRASPGLEAARRGLEALGPGVQR